MKPPNTQPIPPAIPIETNENKAINESDISGECLIKLAVRKAGSQVHIAYNSPHMPEITVIRKHHI